MTDQQAAEAGKISVSVAPAGKPKGDKGTLKANISTALKGAGFEQDEMGVFHAPAGFSDGPADTSLPKDHNRRNGDADGRLRLLIERIERLEEEKKGVGDDIKDVYSEAKSTGYDPKIMRRIVRLRKMKPDDRREAEAVLSTYCRALGMEAQGSLF